MSKTSLRDRSFALVMAGLFLFTAVATSVVVIIMVINQNKTTSSSSATTPASGKLAGTELKNFTPISSVSSLQIIDTKVGTGAVATASSTVSVLYTGAVAATGIIFQSSLDSGPQPVSLSLSNVIVGWQKGIPGMRTGGERRLIIPADEAYGANPPANSGIPANAPLVFDITLLAVK
jgi:FKBP-type peptidyl-prolyl cis-trans isomerase